MQVAVLVGPGLPRGRRARACEAFSGPLFQTHVDLAAALGGPAMLASPLGPVPLDSEIVGRKWPRADVVEQVARWAPTAGAPIFAFADDADALAWREATGGRVQAPLVGTSPLQRRILAGLVAARAELPSWAPTELALVLSAPAPAPVVETVDPPGALLTVAQMEIDVPLGRLLYPEARALKRPRTRGECSSVPRPCPFVGCRHNLFLDVDDVGAVRFRQPGVEPWDVQGHSCALDVADDGTLIGNDVGALFGITRERIRQIGDAALEKMKAGSSRLEMLVDEPADPLDAL